MSDASTFTTGTGNSSGNTEYFIDTAIYVRPDGFFLHRPFDGGMEIGTSKSPDGQICRQTRRYFRYQSGKGIQCSLAINFCPKQPAIRAYYSPYVDGVTYHRVIVETKLPHNLEVGTNIRFVDATDIDYNVGTSVATVVDEFTFTYLLGPNLLLLLLVVSLDTTCSTGRTRTSVAVCMTSRTVCSSSMMVRF